MGIHKRTYTDKTGHKRDVWRVRWLDREVSGERVYRSKQFDTEHKAKTFARTVAARRDEERIWGRPAVVTLSQLWGEYLAVEGAGWQPSTRAGYTSVWKNWLEPLLGDRMLADFQQTSKPLDLLVNHLKQAKSGFGVGAGTERKTVGLLGMMLNKAVDWNLIVGHRCTPRTRQLQPQTPQRINAMISTEIVETMRIHLLARRAGSRAGLTMTQLNQRDVAMLSTMAYAGLRPAEVLALTWHDVDRHERLLNVNKQSVDGVLKPVKNHRSSKKSVRRVPIIPALMSDLNRWRMSSPNGTDQDLVFPSTTLGLWSKTSWKNWTRDVFREAALASGVAPESVRPYDLRTSWCMTIVLCGGINLVQTAKWAGHTTQVSYQYYVRAHENSDDLAIPDDRSTEGMEKFNALALAHRERLQSADDRSDLKAL